MLFSVVGRKIDGLVATVSTLLNTDAAGYTVNASGPRGDHVDVANDDPMPRFTKYGRISFTLAETVQTLEVVEQVVVYVKRMVALAALSAGKQTHKNNHHENHNELRKGCFTCQSGQLTASQVKMTTMRCLLWQTPCPGPQG